MANAFGNNKNFKKSVNSNKKSIVAGDIRQSQLINTFGIGSIVDFVSDTVIIAGTDDWKEDDSLKIYNENLSILTGAEYFVSPKPKSSDTLWSKSLDIPSYVFPEKLYCPRCKSIIDAKELYNLNRKNSQRNNCFMLKDGKTCNGRLVASRFVVICDNGHIEDFPYSWWVHRNKDCSSGKQNPRIEMFNIDNKSDVDSLVLKCVDCGKTKLLKTAFTDYAFQGENSYRCSGNHPHLHNKNKNPNCDAVLKTRLRTSTGVYFPVTRNALSIPPWSKKAVQIIQQEYNVLEFMPKENALLYLEKNIMLKAPKNISLENLKSAYELVIGEKGNTQKSQEDIFYDEYVVLKSGDVDADEEYSAKSVNIPIDFQSYFKKVVAVDKLTVIDALCGFTRGKPLESSNILSERIVPLSENHKNWLPAIKLLGEAVFIEFNENSLKKWSDYVDDKYEKMKNSLNDTYYENSKFSNQYIFLHTFSHLLIRQLADVCGYNSATLKERIYSTFENNSNKMNGILIYLTSSDCEGSLGGLINAIDDVSLFENILKQTLKNALWCSGDPLCVNSEQQGNNSLNYSACHDCVLLPETSCEFRNILLDRVSVVGTPNNSQLGFFGELVKVL